MKRLITLVVLAVTAGCDQYQPPAAPSQKEYGALNIQVWHDDRRQVTCWLYGGINGGISCLPDGVIHQ